MTSLYLHNFRGFENTFLNLQDVNFFLGENSTGKTSVLKIIKILSSPNFKIKYDLGSEFSEIGTYYDIVYRGGANTHFEVGYSRDGYLIKIVFKPRDNRPVIHKLYALIEGKSIEFSFESNFLKFKHLNEGDRIPTLADWVQEISSGKFDAADLESGDSRYFEDLPFSTGMFSIAERIYRRKGKSDEMSIQRLSEVFSSVYRAFDSALISDLTWIDPIRAEPKRLYDEYSSTYNPTGSHAPYLLKQILTKNQGKKKFRIKEFLKYGEASGLFLEIVPKIFDKKDDSSPFELLITLGKKSIKLNHVGYGVSQVLPLVVEVMNMDEKTCVAIQQPEVHLHPRAQAAFGDFVFAFAENDDKKFIIETHSDFLIDRFRLAVNKASSPRKKVKIKAQVCFFERTNTGNTLKHISIMPDGSYSDEQPSGFRDFFLKEQLELLSM